MIQHPKKFLHTHPVFQLDGKLHFWNRQLPSSTFGWMKKARSGVSLPFSRYNLTEMTYAGHCKTCPVDGFEHTNLNSRLLPNPLLISRCPSPSAPFLHSFRSSPYVALKLSGVLYAAMSQKASTWTYRLLIKLKAQESGCSLLGGHSSVEAQSDDVAPHLNPTQDVTCRAASYIQP